MKKLSRSAHTVERESLSSRKSPFCVVLTLLLLSVEGFALDPSPTENIRSFFDSLVNSRVQEAAATAVFSDEEARAKFVRDWTGKAPSVSGYSLEGWEIEGKEGDAEIVLKLADGNGTQDMKVRLVKLDDAWKIAPEEDYKLEPPARPSPPKADNLEDLVDVTSKREGRRIELFVANGAPCSLLFRFEMTLPSYLQPDRALPLDGILPPAKNPIPLCNLNVVGDSPLKHSWRYTVRRADDSGEIVPYAALVALPEVSVPDESRFLIGGVYTYGLPYPLTKSYLIWQGPGGEFSHSQPGSRYAVDFSMPLGSEIAAARDGVVISVIQKNADNREDEVGPASAANEVLILHSDGSMGVYAHLTTDGARVSFGETVRRGQIIGLSGNSGYSRGPHLHFDILGYVKGRCVSLPFDFLSWDGTAITPRKGLILLAGKDGVATISGKETTPRRVVHRCYEKFDAEIHYFAKTVEFLAVNKSEEPVGVELSFSTMDNVAYAGQLPRKIGLPPDGKLHPVLALDIVNFDEKSAFSYVFRRVEAPGMEHIPLRVERDAGKDYVVEIRYYSDRIEFYAENTSSHRMAGSLNFPSLTNLTPKEKMPREILLPANASPTYLTTLRILHPAKGYSYMYEIGPSKK